MSVERNFNPERLELARKRRGLRKVALANKAAIPRVRLQRIVAGQAEPTDDELQSLSEVLGFPIRFFFLEELATLGPATFRSMSTMTAAERDATDSIAQLAWSLNSWIDERYHLPEPSIPDLSMYPPAVAANALRNHWGLGEQPAPNMVRLLESRGVRVFSLVEKTRNVDAFSLWADGAPFVFLNTYKTPEHSRTDAAHELGHLVMRHHKGAQIGPSAERDAQTFAGVFLVPEKSVIAHVGRLRAPTVRTLAAKKHIWKVAVSLLAYRLNKLDLISDYYYRGICIELNKYRKSWEPEGIERETSRVLQSVFDDLKKSGVTKADVAHDLCISKDEVEALVFGLAGLSAISGQSSQDWEAEDLRNQMRLI